jgi:hypothetical protein|tara:strand:+ start:36029 stop:36319 length:291 start_codon:yes stop_codon:yes gene_type:complete
MLNRYLDGFTSLNPYNVKVGDTVIVNKGNFPILTISHVLSKVVYFEEINDSCFIDECSKRVKLFENGGAELILTAQEYNDKRDYFRRKLSVLFLIA